MLDRYLERWTFASLGFFCFWAILGGADAAPRTFQSTEGKELEAEVVAVHETEVELKRSSDEKVFRLPLARLSEEDREWLLAWEKRQEPDLPPPLVSHPLNWTRLSIHAPKLDCHFGFEGLIPAGSSYQEFERHDCYLPKGAWVRVGGGLKFGVDTLVRYDGNSDWLLTADEKVLRLRSGFEEHSRVIGFRWHPRFEDEDAIAQYRNWIEQGATVHLHSIHLEDGSLRSTKPVSMVLDAVSNDFDWSLLPDSLEALQVNTYQTDLNLEGLERLSQLEYLQIYCRELQGLSTLKNCPRLETLSLTAFLQEEEIPFLADLENLRFLGFNERTEEWFPREIFDCLSKLTKLEAVHMGVHSSENKYVRPAIAFANCPNLTSLRINEKFYQKGEFLRVFPRLSSLDLTTNRVKPELVEELMAQGQFKHLQELTVSNAFPIGDLPNLQKLTVNFRTGTSFKSIGQLPYLDTLTLSGAGLLELEYLLDNPELRKVRSLTIKTNGNCDLDLLTGLPNLKELNFMSHDSEVLDLTQFDKLESLKVTYSPKLRSLLPPRQLLKLEIDSADNLNLEQTTELPYLQHLNVSFSKGMTSLKGLGKCEELKNLILRACPQLNDFNGLNEVESLINLRIERCGERENMRR